MQFWRYAKESDRQKKLIAFFVFIKTSFVYLWKCAIINIEPYTCCENAIKYFMESEEFCYER